MGHPMAGKLVHGAHQLTFHGSDTHVPQGSALRPTFNVKLCRFVPA